MTQPVCCARAQGSLTFAEGGLRQAVRRLNKTPLSGYAQDELVKAKADVAQAKQAVIDHEAEHAA